MWNTPSGVDHINIIEPTSIEHLQALGFAKFRIPITPERPRKVKSEFHAKRKQFVLQHVSVKTIHSVKGDTMIGGLKGEISLENSCPWGDAQCLVLFIQTKTAAETIFVGQKEFGMNKVLQLITKHSQ